MPLFQLDIEKRLGSEFWTNRYFLNADTFENAVTIGGDVTNMEQGFHATQVTFTRYRLSDPNSEQYVIVPVNETGTAEPSGSLLPLFNTWRVDLPAVTGRPSRKYYRGVLSEGNINGDALDADFGPYVVTIGLQLSTGPTVNGIVDPQGQILTGATSYPFVQMRQLRRSRRRRTGGGIFQ